MPGHNPGGRRSRKWLAGLVLGAIAAVRCGSATPAVSAAPAVARSSFGQGLSLAMSLGSALTARTTSVTAEFTLTNNGSTNFDGCFGPSWGVSVIVGGADAGHLVRAEHPSCAEKLTLLPGQKIVWSKKVPLSNLSSGHGEGDRLGEARRPGCVRSARGCHETSIATPLMTVAIGGR